MKASTVVGSMCSFPIDCLLSFQILVAVHWSLNTEHIPIRIVEGNSIHNIFVSFKYLKLFP